VIPVFPQFKNLELNDKEEFEKITKKFDLFSDYNFISLWVYNVENDSRISILNENIVIRFRDYITNEPFYSFLGNNKVENTINKLLELSRMEGFESKLKLIPEINIKDLLNQNKFIISEDRDNFDYIASVEDLANLFGDEYHSHKNLVNYFNKTYTSCHINKLNLLDPAIHDQILKVFYTWELKKDKKRDETIHELSAIQRILRDVNDFDLISLGVYDKEELVGFIIASLEQKNYAIGHFIKADFEYKGIFYLLNHELAKILKEKEYKHFNMEQDLGIPGLRNSKELWNPTHFLKKYIITEI
jgi:uncharacterized protein